MEQFQFATELAMVAFLGFLELLKVLVEFGPCFEGRAIDALQLWIVRVPFVVSARDRGEFKCADVPCPHDVRTGAEVSEVSVAIQRDFFVVRYPCRISSLNLLGIGLGPSAPNCPSFASPMASSRETTIRSKGWFSLMIFFISASILSKSSGEM